jgi:hypothetical protein
MRMVRDAAVTVFGLCAFALGCARHQETPATVPAPSSGVIAESEPIDSLVLEVENHNWSDIIVYIAHDGVTSRFATVTATTNASLPIPSHLVGATGVLRLAVHRVGGNDQYASEPVTVRTGSTVRLTVESRLTRSSVAVW